MIKVFIPIDFQEAILIEKKVADKYIFKKEGNLIIAREKDNENL